MIKNVLQRDPSGSWTIPSSSIAEQIENRIVACYRSLAPLEDTNERFTELKSRIEHVHETALQEFNRNRLALEIIRVAIAAQKLKTHLPNEDRTDVDSLLEELTQGIGEVPAADRENVLLTAAQEGYKEVVESLLNQGAKVDAADNLGSQPLYWAASSGHKEVVELLLQKGAKVYAANKDGWQSLDLAAQNGHQEVVELIQNAAKAPKPATNTPVSTVISKKEWAAAATLNLPPYPHALQDFLEENCTIWPGKKRAETHIVVPLFPDVLLSDDEKPVPLTLATLDKLDKDSGGPGHRHIWIGIPKNNPIDRDFSFAVMTRDVLPGSMNKSYIEQLSMLPAGYRMPSALEAATALLWESRHTGTLYIKQYTLIYTRCSDTKVDGYYLVVGGFAPSGLIVRHSGVDIFGRTGVAAWRKF